jgi:Zn-dependent alcohol dehydrogenase
MICPHCKLENIPDASTCDCGYDFGTGVFGKSSTVEHRNAKGTEKANPRTAWILLGSSVLAGVGIIATTPSDSTAMWGLSTIGLGAIFMLSAWVRVRTRSKVATADLVVSGLLLLFCFMLWAATFD